MGRGRGTGRECGDNEEIKGGRKKGVKEKEESRTPGEETKVGREDTKKWRWRTVGGGGRRMKREERKEGGEEVLCKNNRKRKRRGGKETRR